MSQTRGANSKAKSFRIRLGMLSGPTAFDVWSKTRTCMPHTLKLIIHQEQIAGALPDTGVGNGQSAQQNSYWSYLLNAWYLCLYQGTESFPCLENADRRLPIPILILLVIQGRSVGCFFEIFCGRISCKRFLRGIFCNLSIIRLFGKF